MDVLWQDFRFALRTLIKNPGFTAIAVLTLALGIGANASIFSVVNGILLRPLPYKDPDRLITFRTDFRGVSRQPGLGGAEVQDFHNQVRQIEDIGMIVRVSASLTGEKVERLIAVSVSPNFFLLLGVSPILGRQLDMKADNVNDHVSGVIISYDLWKRAFNGDPSMIGKPIQVNNYSAAVVGILPKDFRLYLGPGTNLPPNIDLYFPADIGPESLGTSRIDHNVVSVGRLKDGVTLNQAQQEVDEITARLVARYPNAYQGSNLKFHLVPLHQDLVQEIRPAILALLGAVGFVLLIACSNVANMLLARGKAREKELVVRAALGAGRTRIIRQLLTENLTLGLMGGLLGLLLASWGISFLLYLRPANLPRQDDIGMNGAVLAYAFAISILAGLIFGLVPAWKATKLNINETLKEGGRSAGTASGERLRNVLVIAQVALSLVLFVGAGLMIRTFAKLNQVDLGFNSKDLLTFEVPLSPRIIHDVKDRLAIYRAAIEKVRILPGVESVGGISPLPLSGSIFVNTYALNEGSSDFRTAPYYAVLPGYFESMQIKLLHGRYFTDNDNQGEQSIIIVDRNFAQNSWPGENPIGKKVILDANRKNPITREVIGVVEHVKVDGPRKETNGQIYLPYISESNFNMFFTVRGKGNLMSLAGTIKQQIEPLGGGRPVNAFKMMDESVANATADSRFALFLLSILAFIALVLCSVGLYGVISYSVSQRVTEIGIRTALGARPADILKMVIGKGLALTLIGVVLGLGGAFAITRLMSNLLFKVGATDPTTFAGVSILLIIIGLIACYIPARRASRIDPMTALR